MPLLLPLLYTAGGAGLGAWIEGKIHGENSPSNAIAAGAIDISPTKIAYYAALGFGVYWIARKSGAIK